MIFMVKCGLIYLENILVDCLQSMKEDGKMSLWKYKYFVDVVDMKSFTKAGKKNYVTQTAISQQIAKLEKEAGGKLISRESGSLEVTELGRVVYDKAREMLKIYSQMEKEIEQIQRKDVIRIGIDITINKLIWAKMQELIDTYYSEEDFQFSRIDGAVGNQMLAEHALDIYIGYGVEEEHRTEDLGEFALSEHPIGVYVGEKTTLHASRMVSLEDLKGYTRYGTDMYPCSIVEDISDKFRNSCGKICHVDNAETMKIKVEFNDGYAFVDSYYFSQYSGNVYPVSDWRCPQQMKVYYRRNREKRKLCDVLARLRQIAKEL